jgi:L-threonylcarbamoyladenylate synthase
MDEKIVTKEELLPNIAAYNRKLNHSVFITPTDTIYGLSCNATDQDLVNELREIKGRNDRPFSVIAPSKEWIFENCYADTPEIREKIALLPGPYTLIIKLKNKDAVAKSVLMGSESLGIRIPDHWISDIATQINSPLVTTSANKTGENFMTSIDNASQEVVQKVSMVIYEGEINGHPSTLIRLDKDEVEVIKRK